MKKTGSLFVSLALMFSTLTSVTIHQKASAVSLLEDNFMSDTLNNSWLSGGNPTSACLTASMLSGGDIPGCDTESAIDSDGNGALRLTNSQNTQAGFVINQTPISADDGLQITFDMYQYGGSGADGISFFLIDGSANPVAPGASGGSLGYASSMTDPGIVGGYVGVGFDRYGNFSSADVGAGGPGAQSNSIVIRGSEDTNYQYVTRSTADTSLSSTTRANSELRVRINISTSNVMSVAIDYGSGYVTELSNIDLETINGEDSLPDSFKFGFAASTGGATNVHEIRGLAVATNPPNVGVEISHSGNFTQGSNGQFTIGVNNDASAQTTEGTITVTNTLPLGLTPTNAAGIGWECSINEQVMSCTRPGDGANSLAPGASTPNITLDVLVAEDAAASLSSTVHLTTPNNGNSEPSATDNITVLAGSYMDNDGIFNAEEEGSPNGGDANDDGTSDATQNNVTSLINPVTGNYAVLESSGCTTNTGVRVTAESSNVAQDGDYTYPAGLMEFNLVCGAPGDTATVTQYFYGTFDVSKIEIRKYNSIANTYTDVSNATVTAMNIGGQTGIKVVYEIIDGGELDEDALANGVIVDPAGPAILNSTVSSPQLERTGGLILYQLLVGFIIITTAATISRRGNN